MSGTAGESGTDSVSARRLHRGSDSGAGPGGLLDNRRLMGFAFLAPAVVYIVLLIGVPFVTAFAYSLSDATVGNTSFRYAGLCNFRTVLNAARLPRRAAQHRRLHPRRPGVRPDPGQHAGADPHRAAAAEPRRARRDVGCPAGPDHAVANTAGALRDRLAVDVRLQVQPDRLSAGADRPARSRHRPGPLPQPDLARQDLPGQGVDHLRPRVAHDATGDRHPDELACRAFRPTCPTRPRRTVRATSAPCSR